MVPKITLLVRNYPSFFASDSSHMVVCMSFIILHMVETEALRVGVSTETFSFLLRKTYDHQTYLKQDRFIGVRG